MKAVVDPLPWKSAYIHRILSVILGGLCSLRAHFFLNSKLRIHELSNIFKQKYGTQNNVWKIAGDSVLFGPAT